LSTLALSGSDVDVAGDTERTLLGNLDLLLLALALPVFVVAGWPLLGYAVAAAAWVAQRLAQAYAASRAARSLAAGDRRDAFKTTAVSAMGRVWLVSISVLVVGLAADREDGLAAALLAAALFTVHFASLALAHREEPA
jgi:hypothetical protein